VEHFPVPHVRDAHPDTPSLPSPLANRPWPRNQNFAGDGEEVVTTQVLRPHRSAAPRPTRAFLSAGPCERIYWDPATVRAAVVTCGGLCPGLNTVIREVVNALHFTYGVRAGNVFGVPNGFRGFYEGELRVLTPKAVSTIHLEGGSVLGTSRGGFDLERILGAIVAHRLNMVFVIGGDGTHRGALQLLKGATARNLRLSVACVPKTIDNDIGLIDKSFGFDTAVEAALVPLACAHTEALAAQGGVGLVKLMGRQSGFIALYASLASRDVNVTLIPEAPWRLSALLAYLEKRLAERGHCLVAVAEGAMATELKEAAAAAAVGGDAGAGGGTAAPAPCPGGSSAESLSTQVLATPRAAPHAAAPKTDESGACAP
jgi:6-phosphofructokinase 1